MQYFIAVPWVSALGIFSHPCYWEHCACFCSTTAFSFRFYICYIISLRMIFGLCWMHTWWNYSFDFLVSMPINNIPWQHPAFFPSERVNGFRDCMAVKTHGWPWNRCIFNDRSTLLFPAPPRSSFLSKFIKARNLSFLRKNCMEP